MSPSAARAIVAAALSAEDAREVIAAHDLGDAWAVEVALPARFGVRPLEVGGLVPVVRKATGRLEWLPAVDVALLDAPGMHTD